MSENNIDRERKFQELIQFVRDQTRELKMPMTRETLIEDGLGVTGDDAEELIFAFSRKFGVDISNFLFGNYFNNEPNVFTIPRKLLPFTIGHLEKAMIAGRLDDDIING